MKIIDTEKLNEVINEIICENPVITYPEQDAYDDGYNDGLNRALSEIEYLAVEIICCKDCKYLKEIDNTSNLYVCDRIDIGMDGEPSFLNPKNDFCSRGERKEIEE